MYIRRMSLIYIASMQYANLINFFKIVYFKTEYAACGLYEQKISKIHRILGMHLNSPANYCKIDFGYSYINFTLYCA